MPRERGCLNTTVKVLVIIVLLPVAIAILMLFGYMLFGFMHGLIYGSRH